MKYKHHNHYTIYCSFIYCVVEAGKVVNTVCLKIYLEFYSLTGPNQELGVEPKTVKWFGYNIVILDKDSTQTPAPS